MDRSLLIGLCLADGLSSVLALCVEPAVAEVPVLTTRLSEVEATYERDWPLVYKCDQGTGYGYIQITCGESDVWMEPVRQCGEDVPFGVGSGVGVAIFALTCLITVAAIILATLLQRKHQKQAENEMAPRPQSPPGPGPAQNGSVGKKADNGSQEDRRTEHTEVDLRDTGNNNPAEA